MLMRDQENQEIGEERGKEIGRQLGREEIARAMLSQQEPIDKIALYTGLSQEEIERLKK